MSSSSFFRFVFAAHVVFWCFLVFLSLCQHTCRQAGEWFLLFLGPLCFANVFIAVIEPGLIRIGCGAVAGQLRGQTVNVNRELLLYSRQHDTVQSMRYFHSRVVLPALYCQRIHTYACAAASCCLASNLSNRELHTARICLGECIHKIAPKPPFESPK